MALNLANYEKQARGAVKAFWGNRAAAKQKQIESGKADQGERAGVTSGKNMDGFADLIVDLVRKNGQGRGHPSKARVAHAAWILPSHQAVGHAGHAQWQIGRCD